MNLAKASQSRILSLLVLMSFLLIPYEFMTPVGTIRAIVFISIVYLFLFYKNKFYGSSIIKLFLIIVLYSIISILYTNFYSFKTFTQIIFILFSAIIVYTIYVKLGIEKMYKIYLYLAIFISFFLLIQQIGYYLNISFLYDYSFFIPNFKVIISDGVYRPSFIFSEPSAITYINAIAFTMSIYSIVYKNILKKTTYYMSLPSSLLIIYTYLTTFSSLGYIVATMTFISLVKLNFKNIIFIVFLFSFFSFFLLNNANFMYRVDGVLSLFQDDSLSVAKMNLSVWAIYSNLLVSWHNFVNFFPIGVGIGNHPLAYDTYKFLFNAIENLNDYELNKQNAAGLFSRIMSEIGFVGIVVLFYFLYKFRISNCQNKIFHLLSNAFLIGIIIILFRHGSYISSITIFYFVGYYYIGKYHAKDIMKNII